MKKITDKIDYAYRRLSNAVGIGWWCLRNPQTVNSGNFKMLSDLLGLILKVSETDRPLMTHIALVHPEDGKEHQIVSIWAGAGMGSSPTKRIAELLEENARLKSALSALSKNIDKHAARDGE